MMDRDAIEDMFQPVGPVDIRRLFGGKGIYSSGKIIAIEYENEILLKADRQTSSLFEAAGARQWTYPGKNEQLVAMPYWSIPEAAYDDPDEMAKWLALACEAGMRSR